MFLWMRSPAVFFYRVVPFLYIYVVVLYIMDCTVFASLELWFCSVFRVEVLVLLCEASCSVFWWMFVCGSVCNNVYVRRSRGECGRVRGYATMHYFLSLFFYEGLVIGDSALDMVRL
jgi:hypothetical protein